MNVKKLSKIIFLLCSLILLNDTVKGQVNFKYDSLIWEKDTLIVVSKSPLDEYNKNKKLKKRLGKGYSLNGYNGIWKIKNDSLFLIDTFSCLYANVNSKYNGSKIPFGYSEWYTGNMIVTNGKILRRGDINTIYESEKKIIVKNGNVKEVYFYENILSDAQRIKRRSLSSINSYIEDKLTGCIDVKNHNKFKDSIVYLKYNFTINEKGRLQDVVLTSMNMDLYSRLVEEIKDCLLNVPEFEIIQEKGVPVSEYFYLLVKVNFNSTVLSSKLEWSILNEYKIND